MSLPALSPEKLALLGHIENEDAREIAAARIEIRERALADLARPCTRHEPLVQQLRDAIADRDELADRLQAYTWYPLVSLLFGFSLGGLAGWLFSVGWR